ncbi:hypothetical protein BJV78DRAFT_15461 [Lactifluus subvellereus]|nr:hypothetical protein BJV78DRAFT_15461 [Lactifluus subvellereus]
MALVRKSATFAIYSVSASTVVRIAGCRGQFSFRNTSSIAAYIDETPAFSCENTSAIRHTCCSPTPGGLVLETQLWVAS